MKIKIQFLIILISIFFSFGVCSKEVQKSCDELLANDQYEDALKTKKDEYKSVLCHGKTNLRLSNFEEALKDFKLADKLAKSDTDRIMADLLFGMTLKEAKNIDQALLHFKNSYTSLKLFKPFKRLYLIQIGETLLLLSNYEEAANTFLEAYGLASNTDERAINLDRVAFSYASVKNFSKAIEYQIKANLAFEKAGLLSEYAESGINLALYYLESNDLTSAERILLKFEKFTRENEGMYYLSKVLFVESKYYKKKSNMDLYKAKLDEANKIADEIGAEDLKILFKDI